MTDAAIKELCSTITHLPYHVATAWVITAAVGRFMRALADWMD